jgi:hypothetical protein
VKSLQVDSLFGRSHRAGRSKISQARIFLCIALCVWPGSLFAASQTSPFEFLQTPGPYPVGLKVVDQYDRSRNYPASPKDLSKSSAGDDPRPLRTLIWYPSLRSTGKPMTVGDYTQLADTEIQFDTPRPERNRWRSLLKTSFDMPLWAVRDAKLAEGHYPVVIYAPSDSSVGWENADLCEYLASHGYVVLASPSMGVSTRDMTDDLAGINAQARDISFLISYAKSLSRHGFLRGRCDQLELGSNFEPVCGDTRRAHRWVGIVGRQHALLPRYREKGRRHSSGANDHTASFLHAKCKP